MVEDPRRAIPRTDRLMEHPQLIAASRSLGRSVVLGLVRAAQDRARRGEIPAAEVVDAVLEAAGSQRASSLTPVLNATGVIIHTNLGRAPLSEPARQALADAAGYVDVELDLPSGARSRRGAAARAALLERCPHAGDGLIVNNGAAALLLAATALGGGPAAVADGHHHCSHSGIVISRGEFIEIGAGFRLSDLITSAGTQLREVGTTNRTHVEDYAQALAAGAGCVLKVHPSNFALTGFTASVGTGELAALCREYAVPLIVDVGSGLLEADSVLPDEPSIDAALAAGADAVIASGDKLLGGPQAGLILGTGETIARLARHPLARAVRADKLTLAAIEATLRASTSPVHAMLHADPAELRRRTETLAEQVGGTVVAHDGRVGGGGGTGVPLPGWALALPESFAAALRTGETAVLPRVHDGSCLIDLRCIPADQDPALADAITAAGHRLGNGR
ncbi:L-seryl-tRNA(Sec) selenium transferase [Brevibacterium sp. p3-SID960]|uniref:L-seryl-tRNA(Sec) selenium transferase n=1 Tax=Brevibacterium sp. p3-SID960 TaxID=2916063 RepID=UPI0021A8329D|nr:L-seryl-tRNA(Sec) selenium transferase [Brevibacterium sp. p3-SID960]